MKQIYLPRVNRRKSENSASVLKSNSKYVLMKLFPHGGIAQWIEQRFSKPLVAGSNPAAPATFGKPFKRNV